MTDEATERVDVVRVVGRGADQTSTVRADDVIVEEPMSIRLDGVLVSTTMRTPGHDYELAVGFCLTDGLLGGADVTGISYCTDVPGETGERNTVDVDTDGRAPTPTPRLGNVSSSCGWCGSEHLDSLCARLSPLPDVVEFDLDVLGSVADAARREQGLFLTTGSVHAAAVFDSRGDILLTREDVGRHNAVDKVVGALALGTGYPVEIPAHGFGLFVSGRASIEMVQKAWAAGFTSLVSVSAPTSLAVDAARRANLMLVGFVRGDAFNVYAPRR
jgi:FdhD protein